VTYPAPTKFFPVPPNWKENLREDFEFYSTVIEAGDGSEETNSVSGNHPRRALEYGTLLTRLDAQRLDALLMAWSGRFFEIAHWAEAGKLISAVPIGAEYLVIDNLYGSFVAGGRAVIYASPDNYELVDLVAAAPGEAGFDIELADGTEKAWPAGAKVFPVFPALIAASTQKARPTDSVVRSVVRFMCEPSSTPDNTGPGVATYTYLGEELYLHSTNWKDGVRVDSSAKRTVIDKRTGKIDVTSVSHFHPDTMEHTWLLHGHAEVAEFRNWLGRREGRARPVYMPTGMDDLKLVADPTSGNAYIDVETSMYGELLAAHPARRDFIMLLRNGSYVARRITSVEAITSVIDRIHFAADPLASTVARSAVKRVSFLGLYRQQEDNTELVWHTDGTATATLDLVLKRPTA
jgi:hypothetical protein